MHGLAVTTIEGIGSVKTKLHPVQERLAKAHGSQCGFCTPGIVMSMYTLLRNSPKPSMADLDVAFQGNLCRCTGYRPIIEGYKTFTEEWELLQNSQQINHQANGITNGSTSNGCAMGANCCKFQKEPEEILFQPSKFTPLDPSQEPIFPPELKISSEYDSQYLVIKGKVVTWYRPTTLSQLLQLKTQYPEAKIVVGNTEIGVEVKFKHMVYPVIIQPSAISEMTQISNTNNGVRIGASTTLMDMEEFLKKQIETLPEEKTRIFKTIVKMLHWFAGKQIRSVGAVGSNIMTGSPISDLLPIFMSNKVILEVQSLEEKREVCLDHNFFTGYRKTVVRPEEILLAINIPYTNKNRYCYAYKQARRREDDIAIVNAAVNVSFEPGTVIIQEIHLAFGGMSFKTVTALKTSEKLKGFSWNKKMIDMAFDYLQEDLPLDSSAPGGMILYRRSLTLSLFFKAFLAISRDLNIKLDKRELSGIDEFHCKEYKSAQYFTVIPETQEIIDTIQRPLVHRSAYKQAAGEAIYCDDIPFFEGQLYFAFVLSTKAYAKIISIDPSEALAMDGVEDFISAQDISPEHNSIGSVIHDEQVFYDDVVTSQGQILGGIIAIDQSTAQKAARKVKIQYQDLHPVIVTIQDAIKYNSFFPQPKRGLEKGNVDKVFREAPHILENECQMGGQEHFYFETQACVAVPKGEDGELDIFSSSQNPTEVAVSI